ncbi:hypothetical protein [Ruminococcus intestinalis]|jgi:hypothetical protein|uniref:hypothetical protein n=1 Tax=Ruminococcus intestinalis TaxID=2763066 RepID=UPI001FAE2AD8|nr:hypothetical protein [Ruminococcus intestinalis]
MDEQKIIFSNRFEKEKFEDYKTDLETGNAITPTFSEANDFLNLYRRTAEVFQVKSELLTKTNSSRPFTSYPTVLKLALT